MCLREWLSGGAPPCQGGGRGFDPRLALLIKMLTCYLYYDIIICVVVTFLLQFCIYARVAQWWSTSLPRRGSRVRSPSRALLFCKEVSIYLASFIFAKRHGTTRYHVFLLLSISLVMRCHSSLHINSHFI